MINKLLHATDFQLKPECSDDDDDATLYVAALKRLFGLEGSEAGPHRHARQHARPRSVDLVRISFCVNIGK